MKKLDKILAFNYDSTQELYNFINYKMNLTYDAFYDLIKISYMNNDYLQDQYKNLIIKCKIYGQCVQKKLEMDKENNDNIECISKINNILNIYFEKDFLTVDQFLRFIKIDNAKFSQYLDFLQNNDLDSYNKYMKIKNEREEKFKEYLNLKMLKISSLLKSGIKQNNEIRQFDIVDYYEIVGVPVKTMLAYLPLVCPSDSRIEIGKFLSKYVNDETLQVSLLYSLNLRFGCKYNEDGSVVKGSGTLFSTEQKREIINYMNNRSENVPYTEEVYKALCRRKRIMLEKVSN